MSVTLRRLFAAAILAATPVAATGAAPVPTTPAKPATPMVSARKALDEVGDMTYQARSLNDVIEDIKKKAKVPVILDGSVFQFGLDPTQPNITVDMKQVKLRDGLKAALATYNLKFGLTAEGLYISTEEGVITRQMRQRVSLDCDGTEFGAAAKQLAIDTGANIVVDPRLGDKAKKSVTLKLEDVPLETAIRLLAEVADLRAVRSSNVLFVTTADKVKEKGLTDDGPSPASPLNPFFPPGGGIGFGGVIGGPGGIFIGPGGIAPPPVVDPAVPPPDMPVQAPPAPGGTGVPDKAPPPAPDKPPAPPGGAGAPDKAPPPAPDKAPPPPGGAGTPPAAPVVPPAEKKP